MRYKTAMVPNTQSGKKRRGALLLAGDPDDIEVGKKAPSSVSDASVAVSSIIVGVVVCVDGGFCDGAPLGVEDVCESTMREGAGTIIDVSNVGEDIGVDVGREVGIAVESVCCVVDAIVDELVGPAVGLAPERDVGAAVGGSVGIGVGAIDSSDDGSDVGENVLMDTDRTDTDDIERRRSAASAASSSAMADSSRRWPSSVAK